LQVAKKLYCVLLRIKGNINSAILYAAQLCGVTKILKVGGIQAIAGLTFGTETIPKVYKILDQETNMLR
jgi:histidinol dehydrogenase